MFQFPKLLWQHQTKACDSQIPHSRKRWFIEDKSRHVDSGRIYLYESSWSMSKTLKSSNFESGGMQSAAGEEVIWPNLWLTHPLKYQGYVSVMELMADPTNFQCSNHGEVPINYSNKFSFLHLDIIRSSIRSWTWHACTSPWALKHGSIILLLMSSFKQFSAASSRSKPCLSLTNPSAIHFLTKTLVQITQSSGYAPRYSKHVLSSWDRLIVAKS